MLEHLFSIRIDSEKDHDLLCSINLSIILYSACLIEGELEESLLYVLDFYRRIYNRINISEFETRKAMNFYYGRIEDELDARIRKTTGIEKYDELFELLLGASLSTNTDIKSQFEGIRVLFQLRNMLAHGRQVHAIQISRWSVLESLSEIFIGGYKNVENYLFKKGLISKKYTECEDDVPFFTNEISNHFYQIADQFLKSTKEFIEQQLKVSDSLDDLLKTFNEQTGNNYSINEFISKVLMVRKIDQDSPLTSQQQHSK